MDKYSENRVPAKKIKKIERGRFVVSWCLYTMWNVT